MSQTDDMPNDQPFAADAPPYAIVVERVEPARPHRVPLYVRSFRAFLSAAGELTAMALGLAFFVLGALAYATQTGGADLARAVPNIEAAFANAFEGREASIGSLTVQADAASGRLRLIGDQIRVDGDEGPLAQLSGLEADLDYAAALRGQTRLKSLAARGAVMTVRRTTVEGGWEAGLGTPRTLGRLGPVVPFRRGSGALVATPSVELQDATVFLSDAVTGADVTLEDARLSVSEAAFALEARVSDADGGGRIELLSARGNTLTGTLVLEAIRPDRLAPEAAPWSMLQGVAFPVDAELRLGAGGIAAQVEAGEGTLTLGSQVLAVEALDFDGVVDPAAMSLAGDVTVDSDRLSSSGFIRARRDGTAVAGAFDLDRVRLRVPAMPDGRIVLDGARADYLYDPARRSLRLNALSAGLIGTTVSGDVTANLPSGRAPTVKAKLDVDGELSPETLLSLWPEDFVGGARRWIARSMLSGRITNLSITADFAPDDFDGVAMADDAVNVSFDVADGTVRYISTMTPIANASGRGTLRGNSFDFQMEAGAVGPLGVQGATVSMPRLRPKGGPLTIVANGSGAASDMLRLIDEEPFQFATLYGLDPDAFGGTGEIELTVTRPLREFIAPEQVDYGVTGTFRDASVPFALFGQPLTDADITLVADKRHLAIEGPVSFGPWRTQMKYVDVLGDGGAAPTRASLEGDLSRDALDGFGVGLRSYFDGDIPVRVDALTDGLQLINAEVRADFTDSNITIDPYWTKPRGIASELTFRATRDGDITTLRDLTMSAPGMSLAAEAALRLNGQLERLRVESLTIRDVMNIDLLMVPNADRSRLDVTAGGTYLDIAPSVQDRLANPQSGSGLPIDLQGRFERLRLAEDYVLKDAEVMFASDGLGVERARIAGSLDGRDAAAAIVPTETGRELTLRVPDASGAAQALFGWEGIAGGEMLLTAGLPPVGAPGAVQGEIRIDDISLERAPILAQLLSIASLTGLGDTLSGQGLNFKKVRGEFAYRDGVLSLRDTRASGPALGITVEGEIGLGERLLDLNGVLVPAYTVNSFLGDVPLIGDILVGDKGEGIVSLGYTVAGPYSGAQVAVNPLSAVTPGVFRDIFEPQREDIEDIVAEDTVTDTAEAED